MQIQRRHLSIGDDQDLHFLFRTFIVTRAEFYLVESSFFSPINLPPTSQMEGIMHMGGWGDIVYTLGMRDFEAHND